MAIETLANQAAGAAMEALGAHLAGACASAFQAFLRRRPALSDGGSVDERRAAAAAFRVAVIEYKTALSLLAGLRVRLAGAVVTLPIVIKQLHRIPALSDALADTALELCTVGTQPVIDQANVVVEALNRASREFGSGPAKSRGARVSVALSEVDEALGGLTMAVRLDCGHAPLSVEGTQ